MYMYVSTVPSVPNACIQYVCILSRIRFPIGISVSVQAREILIHALPQALLPLVKNVVGDVQTASLYGRPVLTLLWEALLELDDLTASTASVMTLIAGFLEEAPDQDCLNDGNDLSVYLRRLWPFFR